jgi:hypothetical protein
LPTGVDKREEIRKIGTNESNMKRDDLLRKNRELTLTPYLCVTFCFSLCTAYEPVGQEFESLTAHLFFLMIKETPCPQKQSG